MTKLDPAAEEAAAIVALTAARRDRLRQGRVEVHEWPWQIPKRPPAPEPEPVVDIVALACHEQYRVDVWFRFGFQSETRNRSRHHAQIFYGPE